MFAALTVAQPTLPHRVYGEVTSDSDGSAMSGLNVSFRNSSSYIAGTQNTSTSGFYDMNIDNLESEEAVYLFLDGSNTSEHVNFSRGSSSELNCRFDGSSCVENSGGNDDEDTDDNNNDNNGGNTNPSGGGGGSGGGSGTSGGGGGGFAPVPDDSVEVSSDLESGEANVSVGDVDEDQFVEVEVSGADYLDGFSFTADSSGNTSVFIESSPEMSVQRDGPDIFHYFEVNVSGIDSFRNASVGYTLPDSVLTERNVSLEEVSVVLDRNGTWQSIDNSVTYEGISSYSFRADSGTYDGIFGVELPLELQEGDNNTESDQEQELEVQSLTVTPLENETADVKIVTVNNKDETVNDSINLYKDGESIKEWSLSLESGERRELSHNSKVSSSELHRFSAGSESTSIGSQKPDKKDNKSIPVFLVAIVAVLVIVTGLIIYVYVIEYRRASELDEVIEDIERKGNQVNNEMGEMKDNIRNLRDNVRGNRDNRE